MSLLTLPLVDKVVGEIVNESFKESEVGVSGSLKHAFSFSFAQDLLTSGHLGQGMTWEVSSKTSHHKYFLCPVFFDVALHT